MKTLKQRIYEALSYTALDYETILNQLVDMFKDNLTNGAWDNISEADPMFIMMSLFAAHTDILNYMMDYRVLEGYMSTARERASMVRIANSAGYKIPSYRAATELYKVKSISDSGGTVENVSIPRFTQFIASSNESWVYTGPDIYEQPDELANKPLGLVQGVPLKLGFKPDTIDETTLTQIVTNQSISIGTNSVYPSSALLVKFDNDTQQDWAEVESIIGKSYQDRVYELNVDPYGTTYIKFPLDTDLANLKNAGVDFELDYVVTNGATTLSSPLELTTTVPAYLGGGTPTTANLTIEYYSSGNFVRGSDPATPQEIKEGYANYRGTNEAIITLKDYEQFVLNQKVVPNIDKVLIIDKQGRSDGKTGHDGAAGTVSVYAVKEGGELLSPEEEDLLNEAISEVKVSGIVVTINEGPGGADIIAPETNAYIELSPMPSGQAMIDLKAFVADYINSKGIGSTLTVTELYNLILNSKYASHYSNGISIIINSTETSLELPFNKFFQFTSSNIT